MAKLRITKIISSNGETKRQKDNLRCLGIRRIGKQITDHVEYTRIGCGIRSRRPSDRGLIDIDDLIEFLHTGDGLMFSGKRNCPV